MDVLNRKLFANKEARNKLAEMGGIMASSEALMREAQNVPMYAPGGVVNAPDLQKLRSDRSVRDSAERYGMEVDEYIGRMSDGEKRFIASKPKNEVGIDTAGAPDNELTNALATSRMGAKFGGFLDNVGQTGIDVASAALRKTGGTGIKMGARLIIAMSETAAFLGFPEQAAEWQTEAQKEIDYGNKMLDGDIGLFGQDRVGFQVPPETGRLYEAARIEGRATSDAPESVVFGNGQLPESIIQARRMNPPSFDPDTPPDSLGYLSEGRGGDPFFDQQEMLLPGVDPASPTSAVPSPSTFSRTDRPVLGIPSTEMTPDGPVRRTDVMTRRAALEREGERLRSMGPLTAGGITDETGLSIAEQRANKDMMKAELDRQQEQQSAVDLIAAESMANQELMQMAGYEETRAKNKAREEDANRIEAEARQSAMDAKKLEFEKGIISTQVADETTVPVPVPGPGPGPDLDNITKNIVVPFSETGEPGSATENTLSAFGITPKGSLKERNAQYQELLASMFGDSDEEKAKEKYLNLAMIGFAIASGASSNALTNISQGLMQGVTKMNEDRAANKTREDKRKTMGIQMSIDDMAADRSFTNQKALLSVRAGMDLKGNIISQFNSSKEVGMDALTKNPLSTLQLPELDMKATKYAWKGVLQTYGLEGLKSAGLYESNKTMLDILQKEIDEENDEAKYMP
jgi:hypothetical protein